VRVVGGRRLGLGVAGDFDREIIVKTNIVEVLRAELARKRTLPPRVAFGTSTDGYQRAEGRYALMPGIIDALAKSPLVRRDLDRLLAASQATEVHLGLSIAMLDEELRDSVEHGTTTTAARLATVRTIRDAGLECTVFLSPILPYLNDTDDQLDALLRAVTAAGATSVLYTPLYLATGVKEVFFAWLRHARPDLVAVYTRLYSAGSEALLSYRADLGARIRLHIAWHGLPSPDRSVEDKFALNGRRGKPSQQTQPTLF
jgi:DNA repair photolyase